VGGADNRAMHLLIPCAGVMSDAGRAATQRLALPSLARLLARLQLTRRDAGDEYSRTPPHERALAEALGWPVADGQLPWAARQAQADGIDVAEHAWGLLTPVHQHVGTEQVSLIDPASLQLDDATSRALWDAVRGLFESEGFTTAWGAPLRWYIAHPMLAGLATVSLDRVIGRNVDAWLPDQPQARLLRRLQMEVQMTLHTLPLNEAREERREAPVNATWLSSCGPLQPTTGARPLVDERLRGPALGEDWAAWCAAWQALDGGPIAQVLQQVERGESVTLTLCGERHADHYATAPTSLLKRLFGKRPSDATARAALADL
jgi:hypothetical protein